MVVVVEEIVCLSQIGANIVGFGGGAHRFQEPGLLAGGNEFFAFEGANISPWRRFD